MGGANALLSSPAPRSGVWESRSRLPLLIWASSLCLPDQCGWWWGEGGALEGRGPAWELSRLPVPEWMGQSPSAPLLLLLQGPSHLPLLISPASLLYPQDSCGLGLWRSGNRLGSSVSSPARVGQVIALRSSPALPGASLPPASPDLPGLRGPDLVWPPLLLPPRSPYVLLVHSGVPPFSLGVTVPHQRPAGALVWQMLFKIFLKTWF